MNKKNILVSSLVFGLLMASAAQCPSKDKEKTVKAENEKKFKALKNSIVKLIEAKQGAFKGEELKKEIVDALKGLGMEVDNYEAGANAADGSLERFFNILLRKRGESGVLGYEEFNGFRDGNKISNGFSELITSENVKKIFEGKKE